MSGPGWRARRTAFKAERWRCNGHQTGQYLDITENGARKIYFSMRCVRDATERRGGKGYPYCDGQHEFSLVATNPKMPFVHGDEMCIENGAHVCACDLCVVRCPPPAGAGGGSGSPAAPAAPAGGAPARPGGLLVVQRLPGQRSAREWAATRMGPGRLTKLAELEQRLEAVERLMLHHAISRLEPLPDLFNSLDKENDDGK